MWVNINSIELNEYDIFAFVNLEENIAVKGRLFTGADGVKRIALMNDSAEVYDQIALPSWAYHDVADDVMAAVMREFEKLPGADIKNKVFNAERGNYRPEDLAKLAIAAYTAAIKKPKCVILKYVPNLSLTLEDMDQFILSSEL